MNALVLSGVAKSFAEKQAVRDLDLTVPSGALLGFIGPNGAGKTTTLRMILSILLPDRGSIAVLERGSALQARDRVGYLPEERGLYRKMRVGAFLVYVGRLRGLERAAAQARASEWLERVGLKAVTGQRCEELSKGMQQKIGFIAAVLHDPELIVLDEPFSGLDPVSLREMRDWVRELHRAGKTILFSTHVMAQAEELCERVVMIHDGQKVLDAPVAEIRGLADPRRIHFEPLDPETRAEHLQAVPGVSAVTAIAPGFHVEIAAHENPSRVLAELVAAVPPARIELERKTLEDVFVQIVAGGSA